MRLPPVAPRRVVIAALLLAAVVAIATTGYVLIEGWSWFDAFYMTVLTISTTGGGEVTPLTPAARWFTVGVIVVGFGVLTYTLLALLAYVIEGQFGLAVETRRMRRMVARMRDHYILCGYGRVGREIASQFALERIPFVVLDIQESSLDRAARDGFSIVHGNAAEVAVLREAGVERARGLVTAVDSDADNIYVTLSARVLKADLVIVARANQPDAEPKLRLAGANRIISPYTIGGRRMASLAMRPTAVEFVDTVMAAGSSELLLEDISIPKGSRWAGCALREFAGEGGDAVVLAIKRGDAMTFRPSADTTLAEGDELVAAGPRAAILELEGNI
jgi:voltage-gated potassium channel